MTALYCSLHIEAPCQGAFELMVDRIDYSDASLLIRFKIEWTNFKLETSGAFDFKSLRRFCDQIKLENKVSTLIDEDGGLILTAIAIEDHCLQFGFRSEMIFPYPINGSECEPVSCGSLVEISPQLRVLGAEEFNRFIEELMVQIDVGDS